MNNPATTSDLTARGYVIPDGGTTAAQTRLDEAWRALNRQVRSLETSLTSGWITTEDVVDVVTAAALRVLRNPAGVTESTGSIDDWRETQRYADFTQDLYFTAAELRSLEPVTPTGGSMPYTRSW